MLEKTVQRYGQKTAVVSSNTRLTYAELDADSNKVANALKKLGVVKGDRVVMLLSNNLESVVIYLGIIKAGGIAVPLDVRYRIDELASFCNDCQPKIIFSESPCLELLAAALPRFKSVEHIINAGSQDAGQYLSYQEIMTKASAQEVEVGIEPEDIASMLYTSSAVSRPRGTMMSHQNLVAEAIASGDGFQQTDKDIVMLYALPIHHVFGLTIILLTCIASGSTVVIVSKGSVSNALDIARSERATMFMGVPYIYALAIATAEKDGVQNDLSFLRLCGSAGAVLPVDTIERFKRHYGITVTDLWGLTEALGHVTCQPANGSGKLGSCGKALPGWKVKIVDDNGEELPPNQPGEIIVSGPITEGYYNNPRATAEVIRDGWLYTGDIGKLDEDGYLFFLALKKEMIIVKGQNIYPVDIEDVLSAHPKVAEVAVVGIPDKMRGEIVRAVIRLKAGEEATEQEIRHFCREHLADYKLPKQTIFVDTLPKTASGKIIKEGLEQLAHKPT
jgi:long-chain acyl-CoA synthetase